MADEQRAGGLSFAQGTALTVGAVLGTGVISLPAVAASIAGPASILAWVTLVLLSIPLASTFAALGARFPDAGGVSTFVRRAFGARAASAVGWCFYFAVPMGAVPAAGFAGGYVADLVGGGRMTTATTTAALILLVAGTNAFGVRVSARAQLVLGGILVVTLLVVTVCALPHARLSAITPFAPHGWAAVGPAAAVIVWGFAGWEAVTSLTADYRDPRRDVPRATAAAIVVVGVLYLGVVAASLLVLGPATGASKAPLADLLAVDFGEPARVLTTVVAVLLTVGAMNAYFAGGAKLGAALGRDRALPAWFAAGGTSGSVPRRSLGVTTILALSTLAVYTFAHLSVSSAVLLVTGSFVLVYVLGTAAALRLLPRRTWAWRAALVSFVSTLALLALTGWHVVWALGVAAAAVAYESRSRRHTPGSGASRAPGNLAEEADCPVAP